MLDQNQLFSSASALSGSENLSTAVNIAKTPAGGVPILVAVTAHGSGGSGLTRVEVWGATTAAGTYSLRATFSGSEGTALLNSGSTGRFVRTVQMKDAYARLKYIASGAGSTFTVTAGIFSGSFPDQTA